MNVETESLIIELINSTANNVVDGKISSRLLHRLLDKIRITITESYKRGKIPVNMRRCICKLDVLSLSYDKCLVEWNIIFNELKTILSI